MPILLDADTQSFFRERLHVSMEKRRLAASECTRAYLVNLLSGCAFSSGADPAGASFVERLAEALKAPTPRERFERFRDLGDATLYACGFFHEHFERRGVSRGYVVSVGGRAYGAAADLARFGPIGQGSLSQVYPELAHHFDAFARVLDDVRESTALRTPQDIVRLYERWRRTGSPLLAERLEEAGVFPQAGDSDTVLH